VHRKTINDADLTRIVEQVHAALHTPATTAHPESLGYGHGV
jgi:hypothetical protein